MIEKIDAAKFPATDEFMPALINLMHKPNVEFVLVYSGNRFVGCMMSDGEVEKSIRVAGSARIVNETVQSKRETRPPDNLRGDQTVQGH